MVASVDVAARAAAGDVAADETQALGWRFQEVHHYANQVVYLVESVLM